MTDADLRALWADHAARLEERLRVNEAALRAVLAGRADRALRRYAGWTLVQLLTSAALAATIAAHLPRVAAEPAHWWSALAVLGYLLLFVADAGHRLALQRRVDAGAPVTAQQRAVERLMRAGFRALLWAVLLGTVLWVQLLAVPLRMLGADLYAGVPAAWVWGNVAFGVAVAAAGHLLARRLVLRQDLGPRARRVVAALSGYRLRQASRFLAELAAFEQAPE